MILAISPYCRRPTQDEIFDSMVRIGTATDLPLLTYNSTWRNGEGVVFTGELTRRLIERLPNYIGMKDASFHSEKFLEISRGGAVDAARFRDHHGLWSICLPPIRSALVAHSRRPAPSHRSSAISLFASLVRARPGRPHASANTRFRGCGACSRSSTVVAQRRDDHDGRPVRPDALATADCTPKSASISCGSSSRSSISADRAYRW
jgi:hypothetical protein